MKAKTDSGPTQRVHRNRIILRIFFLLMKLVSAEEVLKKFEADYDNCNIRYGDMKKQLAEDMVHFYRSHP
jgi:tryptophanyl-tRNA synthetase